MYHDGFKILKYDIDTVDWGITLDLILAGTLF